MSRLCPSLQATQTSTAHDHHALLSLDVLGLQVILLFQCIDGVDTCLYALYMQEYGDDAPAPNRKWVYLSYLDSIKYMRPDNLESARPRVALRTMVYHQIIISYLHYIKARGYTSMFIWACPPLQVASFCN